MNAGKVETLLILGGNPVYSAPADLDFAGALKKVYWKAYLGLYSDETARQCNWQVPEAHYLESWGDVRGFDGTVSFVQPSDCSALWRQDGAGSDRNAGRTARQIRSRTGASVLAEPIQSIQFRHLLAKGAARWRGAEHRAARRQRNSENASGIAAEDTAGSGD